MNMVFVYYNKIDKDNFEDIEYFIVVVRDYLDLLARIFYCFDIVFYFFGNVI